MILKKVLIDDLLLLLATFKIAFRTSLSLTKFDKNKWGLVSKRNSGLVYYEF